MLDLFENHIVGFPTRRLKYFRLIKQLVPSTVIQVCCGKNHSMCLADGKRKIVFYEFVLKKA